MFNMSNRSSIMSDKSHPNFSSKEIVKPKKHSNDNQKDLLSTPSSSSSTSAGKDKDKDAKGGNNDKSSSQTKEETFKQFEGEGVVFKAKLIGSELVIEPRGDKMCQNSIQRLKAIIKGQKVHKKRIVMKISYAGVKVLDEKTNELLYEHEVPQISFISSDDTDSRTFGYVCDVPNKAHQFICFKTSGPALQVMSVISNLFEAVLEKKKQQQQQNQQQEAGELGEEAANFGSTGVKGQESADDGFNANDNNNTSNISNKNSNIIDSFDDDDKFSQLIIEDKTSTPTLTGAAATATSDPFELPTRPTPVRAVPPEASLSTWSSSFDKQTSLQHTLSFSSPFDLIDGSDSGIIDSPSATFGASGGGGLAPPPPLPPISAVTQQSNAQAPLPVPPPPRQQQQQQQHQSNPISIERPDVLFDHAFLSSSLVSRPSAKWIQPSVSHHHHHNQQQHQQPHLQRLPSSGGAGPAPAVQQNKSLVYNRSSVSLNDAALSTSRSSFLSPTGSYYSQNDSTDKYAVFNDIDNLPSIFESTSSLGSKDASKNVLTPRQTNPFDDDFFS